MNSYTYIASENWIIFLTQTFLKKSLILETPYGKPFMFFFLNPVNHIEFFSVILKSDIDPGCILLNIKSIPIGEIPTEAFSEWLFYICVLKS